MIHYHRYYLSICRVRQVFMLITLLCPPNFVITFLIVLSCSLILVDNGNKEVSSLVNAFVLLPFAAG